MEEVLSEARLRTGLVGVVGPASKRARAAASSSSVGLGGLPPTCTRAVVLISGGQEGWEGKPLLARHCTPGLQASPFKVRYKDTWLTSSKAYCSGRKSHIPSALWRPQRSPLWKHGSISPPSCSSLCALITAKSE